MLSPRFTSAGLFSLLALACASAPEPAAPAPVIIAAPASAEQVATPLEEEPTPVAAAPPEGPGLDEEAPTEAPAPSPWLAGATKADAIEMRGWEIVLPEPITFFTGKPALNPASEKVLDALASFLQAKPVLTRLRIEGHTDSLGNATVNHLLSGQRALAVAKALSKRGVDCRRLVPVTFGETRPIADNATAEGRAKNRRIALVIAELKGKALGGMPIDGGGVVSGDPCK